MYWPQDYKIKFLSVLLCFGFLLVHHTLFSQRPKTDPKSTKAFNQAVQLNAIGQEVDALKILNKLIQKDPSYVSSYWLAADIYKRKGDVEREFELLKQACNPEYPEYNNSVIRLIRSWYLSGQYANAVDYLNQNDSLIRKNAEIKDLKKRLLFSMDAVSHPVNTKLAQPDAKLNTPFHDYWPSLSVDGKSMVTSVLVCDTMPDGRYFCQEDIYFSVKDGDEWNSIAPVGDMLNTEMNEGGHCLSADGNYLFFTACNRIGGKGSCDIFYSHKNNGQWSHPIPCAAPINSQYWDGHPSIEGNGSTLYFSSNRNGGQGGKDLWMVNIYYNPDGSLTFSDLKNLGTSVNTSKDEISPFIHFDSQTLYFSSDGHVGLGLQDIFVTRQTGNKWSTPVNLGYPINTFHDEIGFVVDASGRTAWMSSERNKKDKDVFSLLVPTAVRPQKVVYYKGLVRDKRTRQPLKAQVHFFDFAASKSLVSLYTDQKKGDFLVCLKAENNYALHIKKPGYLFYSQFVSVNAERSASDPFEAEILLEPMVYGNIMLLDNVFFETGAYVLKPESEPELQQLKMLFDENPEMRIEIRGHTDSIGALQYNLDLSSHRAKSVYDYLIQNGIKAWRLEYKGYGPTLPIDSNKTPEGRARNRRTEAMIIK